MHVVARFTNDVASVFCFLFSVFCFLVSALHLAPRSSRSPIEATGTTHNWWSPFATLKVNPANAPFALWVALEPGSEVDILIASFQRAQGITAMPSALDGLRFTQSRHAADI